MMSDRELNEQEVAEIVAEGKAAFEAAKKKTPEPPTNQNNEKKGA